MGMAVVLTMVSEIGQRVVDLATEQVLAVIKSCGSFSRANDGGHYLLLSYLRKS